MYKLLDYLKELGYEACPENKKGDFSSMGAVRKGYEKDGLRFVFGLNEAGKPPTLIFPRPNMGEFKYIEVDGKRKLVLTSRWDDDIMNIVLMTETPEKIYKSIVEKKGVFIINSTFED